MRLVNHMFYGNEYVISADPSELKNYPDQPLGSVIYKDDPNRGVFIIFIKKDINNFSSSWTNIGTYPYKSVPATPEIRAQLLLLQGTQVNSEPPLA